MRPADDTLPATAEQEGAKSSVLGRVLVGYDGSVGADAAAAFGLWLAGEVGSEVTVVHASPTPESVPSGDQLPAGADQVVAYEREWRWRLENLRQDEDAPLTCRIVRGRPAGALLAAAVETDADVILVGSHGVGRLREVLLGSVSSQVLSHAQCSVMIFPEDRPSVPAAQARTVVVGIDGSGSSRHALELAQAPAVPLDATLTLVHAYDPHVPFVSHPTEPMRDAIRRHGRTVLREARERIPAPLDVVEEELVEGPARAALVAVCERRAPALLVVGSRGMGGFKELLLGSTARWVADAAPCPVLVARARALPE